MPYMRDLDDDYKMSFRGIREVAQAVEDLTALVKHRLTWRSFQAEPDRPGKAAVVNALILWVDNLPKDQRIDVIRRGLALLDEHLQHDGDEQPGGGESGGEPRLPSSGMEYKEPPPPPRPKRGRSSGRK